MPGQSLSRRRSTPKVQDIVNIVCSPVMSAFDAESRDRSPFPTCPPGPLPGIEPDALHTSMEIPLPPGSALLLSTDELVETPGSTSTSHSRSRPTNRAGQRRHHRTS